MLGLEHLMAQRGFPQWTSGKAGIPAMDFWQSGDSRKGQGGAAVAIPAHSSRRKSLKSKV